MTVSEAQRHDLYNGLEGILGTDRADTLMAYLPTTESAALATKDDIGSLESQMRSLKDDMRSFKDDLREVNQRLDRLFLTLAAGLVAVMGATITNLFVG